MDDAPVTENGLTRPAAVFRWKRGLLILIGWIVAQSAVWRLAPDRTHQVMWSYYCAPIAVVLLLVWWLFRSGLSTRTRLGGLGVVVGMVAAFFTVFRFETFGGDMMPVFSRRSAPDARAEARKFWTENSSPKTVESQLANAEDFVIEEDDWNQFRGPRRDGVVSNAKIRTDWKARPPKAVWRHPVGGGWSSFSIVGSRAFTQEQRDELECVVCYNAENGREIWIHTDAASFTSQMGGDGPRATPTVVDEHLYSLGATGILNCLNPVTGERLWTTNILEDARADNLGWGMSASPLVTGDLVIVNPGIGGGDTIAYGKLPGIEEPDRSTRRAVMAYDRISGEEVWASGDRVASYCAPRVEEIGGERQLLIFDGGGIAGLSIEGGVQKWFYRWTNMPQVNVAQPIVHEDKLFISSGYGSGCVLLDVEQLGADDRPAEVWSPRKGLKLKFNDAVYRDGFAWGLSESILTCMNVSTGKVAWRKRGSFGYGQMLLLGDSLVIHEESTGDVVAVEASTASYSEQARFHAIDGKAWNVPAFHRGRLFVRNHLESACYDIGFDSEPERPAEIALPED